MRYRWVADERKLQEMADEILEMVNLTRVVDNLSSNLSGGQMKLLELGRIMMTGAKMIFMDEPIAGVNPTLAHEIFKKINQICAERGITFLVIEHRLDIAFQYVDRVYATDQGKMIAEGTPEEILENSDVIESYLGLEDGRRYPQQKRYNSACPPVQQRGPGVQGPGGGLRQEPHTLRDRL